MTAALLPALAHGSDAGAKNQSLTLPTYGVTLQIPAGWSHHNYANVDEVINLPAEKLPKASCSDFDNAARVHLGVLQFSNHSAAVARLPIVAAEHGEPPTYLTINGWPAMQRQSLVAKRVRGQDQEDEANDSPEKMVISITTAVAVGNTVFRLDGTLPAELPTANAIAEQVKQIGQTLVFQQAGDPAAAAADVQKLQSGGYSQPASQSPVSKIDAKKISATGIIAPKLTSSTAPPSSLVGLSLNTSLGGNGTEPEIAVSTNGQNVVVASQFNGVSSQNGGQTFGAQFGFPNTNCGDSSLAYGRSGNFYEGSIGTTNATCDSQVLDVSGDSGKTFQFKSNPIICTTSTCGFAGTNTPNGVPDQEHIAADRFNAGPVPLAGDQVYYVWRGVGGYAFTCSKDSGATWSAVTFNGDGSPDFPRPTVGQDGQVYVIYTNGDNIEVDRWTSCANGLTNESKGGVVAASTAEVVCPVAGLDRCGGLGGVFRNDLRGPTVTVDDTNASHIYAVYATSTVSGVNENVVISDSHSNGNNGTWSTPVAVNNSIPARRYLPWVCSVGGTAYASWFDRRNATAITNDASDYFGGSAISSGGTLTAGGDFQINAPGTSDPQCGIPAGGFWPNAPDLATYSESCFVQPQLAGICSVSKARCDFSSPPAGCGTCATSNGQPKYGDYNGNACAAGRFYTVFGSATAQPNTTLPSGINAFFSEQLVCCEPQLQIPPPVSLTACDGTTATTTVNMCNTGKTDLSINSIISSNAEITVGALTYPLVVSPDLCFPVQVSLTPGTTTGAITGTLTISSNDPVNPSAIVQVNGTAPAPSINATIVNNGNFGSVCPGGQSSINLNVTNQSSCNLVVNKITTTTDFLPPTVSLPLTLTADATIALPVTFSPPVSQACSNTVPITGMITVFSNDPTQPAGTAVGLDGTVPCPKIATTIPNNGKFGNVCSGKVADLNLEVLNEGQCNLNISSISSSSGQFGVPSGPLVLSADANVDVPVAFQPVMYGSPGYVTCSNTVPETSNIDIVSNDPSNPILVVPVQGIEGCPTLVLGPLNLTGVNDYPPTVSDPTGALGCFTDKTITVSNTGICPLIVAKATTANGLDGKGLALPPTPLEYNVVNTPLPFTLKPGGKPIPMTVRFKPEILTDQNPMAPDQQTGMLNITSNDPVIADDTAALCGEPVYHSGSRILLVDTLDNPISSVTELILTTTGISPQFNETLKPAPLQPPANVCGNTINYHLDNETLNPTGKNPNAYYRILVKDNPHYYPPVDFRLTQCQFQQIKIVRQY